MTGSRATKTGLDGLSALRAELGAPPPRGLADLPQEQLVLLAESLAAARASQRAALAEAGEAAFHHIPGLLRKPVRKLLGA